MRNQEAQARKREDRDRERMERLEMLVSSQHEKLDRLEGLVYSRLHHSSLNFDKDSASPEYEGPMQEFRSELEPDTNLTSSVELGTESLSSSMGRRTSNPPAFYPISSI